MKNIELTTEEAINYLKENVKIHDGIEIAYDRIFAEGEVLNMDFSEYFGKPGFKMLVSLDESAETGLRLPPVAGGGPAVSEGVRPGAGRVAGGADGAAGEGGGGGGAARGGAACGHGARGACRGGPAGAVRGGGGGPGGVRGGCGGGGDGGGRGTDPRVRLSVLGGGGGASRGVCAGGGAGERAGRGSGA